MDRTVGKIVFGCIKWNNFVQFCDAINRNIWCIFSMILLSPYIVVPFCEMENLQKSLFQNKLNCILSLIVCSLFSSHSLCFDTKELPAEEGEIDIVKLRSNNVCFTWTFDQFHLETNMESAVFLWSSPAYFEMLLFYFRQTSVEACTGTIWRFTDKNTPCSRRYFICKCLSSGKVH